MNEDTQDLPETTSAKSSLLSNSIVVAVLFFIIGCLISGAIVFWSQKQMLKAAAEEVKQYAKVKADYEKVKNDLNNWIEYGKELKYKSIGGCSGEKCLFQGSEAVEGYGYLEGYYSTKKVVDWFDVPVTCDVLVTTDGSEELVNDLLETVKRGNTVNSLNDKGELMINISINDLSVTEKNLIKASGINNKVKLKVVRFSPQPRAAPACSSFVDIIAVQ